MVLKARRKQLGCHVGFKIGPNMQSRAYIEPKLVQKLACWGQLEIRRAGNQQMAKNIVKTNVF